ncbi:MAG: Allophanate hydrolase, partial [Frankiales bacterium]|nr:Allophanate hydrolase [Frankiales bacterium]
RWCGEPAPAPARRPGTTLLAVVGAHLSGMALNPQVLALGGRLHSRVRSGPGHRLYRLPGDGVPRPALVPSVDGPAAGIAMELWELPHQGIGQLTELAPAPLSLGQVTLADGSSVLGFVGRRTDGAVDVTGSGGWRAYLRSASSSVRAGQTCGS